jgi:hypothetical protein
MASSFTWAETYAASSGGDNAFVNFATANVSSGSDNTTVPAANPIVVPGASYAYSYERWIRGHWTGTFTSITTLKVWLAGSNTLPGSVKIKGLVKTPSPTTYVTAIVTASTYAGASGNEGTTTNDLAYVNSTTAPGGALSPTYNSGSTGTPATTQCSDYIVLQMVVPSGSSPGVLGPFTYRMGWNEV